MADEPVPLPTRFKAIPRRGLPKVKSGCITCKERRVKCGEEKPECMRCIKFGANCGGYPPRKPKASRSKASTAPKNFAGFRYENLSPVKTPEKAIVSVTRVSPTASFFQNDDESRYFDVFSSKTAFELLPPFATKTFHRIMLQAAQSDPSIRHALIALGALDKTSQMVARADKDASQKAIERRHHETALQQYAVALKHMRERAGTDKPDLRLALLSCLVTLCFEAWNGNQALAMGQIQMGFKLIQAWKEEIGATNPLFSTPAHNNDLLQIFARLDVQAISFAKDGWLKEHPFVSGNMKSFWNSMPSRFSTLEEAEQYNNGLARRTMHILSVGVRPRKQKMFPVNGWWGETDPAIVATQQALLNDCDRWVAAFTPLFNSTIAAGDPERIIFAKLLKIFVHTAIHGTFILCCSDETLYDQFLPGFAETVRFCTDVLTSLEKDTSKWPPDPKFSFDSMVIIPLYIVSHKCREGSIRRKAIQLLLTYSRREGVWDSLFAGKMGEWAMRVEEEFMVGGKVPGWARIHGVGFDNDVALRRAVLTCQQRVSEESLEEMTRTQVITW